MCFSHLHRAVHAPRKALSRSLACTRGNVNFCEAKRFSAGTQRGSSGSAPAEKFIPVAESRLNELMQAEVAYLESVPCKPLSLKEIFKTRDPHDMAKFIQSSTHRRLAFRIRAIESLSCWSEVPELVDLHAKSSAWYRMLSLAHVESGRSLKDFTSAIKKIRSEGRDKILHLAIGMRRVKELQGHEYGDDFLNKWMDSFNLSRIGSNMLLDHYLASAAKEDGGRGWRLGIVNPRSDPTKICRQAARAMSVICTETAGYAPPISVDTYKFGQKTALEPGEANIFSYVPQYLDYIIRELVKNSFHATLKNSTKEDISNYPVHISVGLDDAKPTDIDGLERIVIRVSDRAGGIPLEVGDRIWSYLYGAAANTGQKGTPMAGFGVGLPLSRLYAQYFGGQLDVRSVPGLGTDAYLVLRCFETEQMESLPEKELPTSSR